MLEFLRVSIIRARNGKVDSTVTDYTLRGNVHSMNRFSLFYGRASTHGYRERTPRFTFVGFETMQPSSDVNELFRRRCYQFFFFFHPPTFCSAFSLVEKKVKTKEERELSPTSKKAKKECE